MSDSEVYLFVLAKICEASRGEIVDNKAAGDVLESIYQLASDALGKVKYYKLEAGFLTAVWRKVTKNNANKFTDLDIKRTSIPFRTVLDEDGGAVKVMRARDVQEWLDYWRHKYSQSDVQKLLDEVGQPYLVERSWAEDEWSDK